MKRVFLGWTFCVLVFSAPVWAMWLEPDTTIPWSRLVDNIKAYLEVNPDDAQAYGELARLYNLAFSTKVTDLRAYSTAEGELPRIAWQEAGGQPVNWRKPGQISPEQRFCLFESIRMYQEAIKLAPESSMYWMGLGYMYSQAAKEISVVAWPFPEPLPDKRVLPALKRAWEEKMLDAYRQVRLLRSDPATSKGFADEDDMEAASAILDVLKDRKKLSKAEAEEKKEIEQKFESGVMPGRMITPIIFSLSSAKPLADLIDNTRAVGFDLEGAGITRAWPWVKPDTAMLAWDPTGSGQIQSGRQLIGSATWWMLWEDGYRVLNALDNDRNGRLEGGELRGLAVWRDTNANAASDPGEVVAVSEAGIESIECAATHACDGMPVNLNGLKLRDGRVLPTYDWVTTPRQ